MAEPALEVHRNLWRTKDLALLCGIANAGGGRLVITPEERSRAKGVRKMHRAFEDIPALTLQSFGFSCATEPIMDGAQLCLQVDVPAAPEPLSFEGDHYLDGEGGNELLHGAALDAFLAADSAEEGKGGPLPPLRIRLLRRARPLRKALPKTPLGPLPTRSLPLTRAYPAPMLRQLPSRLAPLQAPRLAQPPRNPHRRRTRALRSPKAARSNLRSKTAPSPPCATST